MIVLRRLVAATLTLTAVTAGAAPAHVDPLDHPAAATRNALDQAAANVAYAQYAAASSSASTENPNNVTCSKPIVHGSEIVPHEDLIFAETRQTDEVFVTATCANLTGQQFRATVEFRIQYCVRISLTVCVFEDAMIHATSSADAFGGIAQPTVAALVTYPDTHVAVGKVRRVVACVRVDGRAGCQTHDYSGTYGG